MATQFSATEKFEISIQASPPLFGSAQDGYHEELARYLTGLTIEFESAGGCTAAEITIRGQADFLDEFFFRGLGRDIEIMGADLDFIWNGYVDSITFDRGQMSITRGPLSQLFNRVKMIYAPILDVAEPETVGDDKSTIYYEDTDSQAKYGIREIILAGGSLIDPSTVGGGGNNEPAQVVQAFLNDYKTPDRSQSLNFGEGGEYALRINCKGYASLLDSYTYQKTNTGYWTLREKLLDVLSQCPGGVISTSGEYVAANSVAVAKYDVNRPASEVVRDLVGRGDANYNRFTWGLYANRKLIYGPAPDSISYYYQDNRIYDENMRELRPWEVRPGRWISYVDFINLQSSQGYYGDPEDPTISFIEGVRFTVPYSLQLAGGRVRRADQLMFLKGIGGI